MFLPDENFEVMSNDLLLLLVLLVLLLVVVVEVVNMCLVNFLP
jgi:hypothetical protein